jgi:hypothetical protein
MMVILSLNFKKSIQEYTWPSCFKIFIYDGDSRQLIKMEMAKIPKVRESQC